MRDNKFLGCSVIDARLGLGLNDQKSQLTVTLIEDDTDGDSFTAPEVGKPGSFTIGALTFNGFFQKYQHDNSISGSPFTVIMEDPRDLLSGVQLITQDYAGLINIANIFNVFGYCENLFGFGGSRANEQGIPWLYVQQALLAMANGRRTVYGGPIFFQGYNYGLDLSDLPQPPITYRIGGSINISLHDLITRICQDAGCDFWIELTTTQVIKVRTISRQQQPTLGQLQNYINTTSDIKIKTSIGHELRNEKTSSFLVGGPRQDCYYSTELKQFWGFDVDGQPILGAGSGLDYSAEFNSAVVYDILGANHYNCNKLEMLCAMSNVDMWMAYVQNKKPAVAARLGMPDLFDDNLGIDGQVGRMDIANVHRDNMVVFNDNVMDGNAHLKMNRMFEFVKSYSSDFLGRQYLVPIRWVNRYRDPDTLRVFYSEEPTDGGYLPDGSTPSGVSANNLDLLQNSEGRYEWHLRYNQISGLDLTRFAPDNMLIDQSGLFVKVPSHPVIEVFGTGYVPNTGIPLSNSGYFVPHLLLKMEGAAHLMAADNFGDISAVAEAAGFEQDNIRNVMHNAAGGYIKLRTTPITVDPNAAFFALKNNRQNYGPWYYTGASGQVDFIYEPDLVPWNYGGFSVMNTVAAIKVISAISHQITQETGEVQIVGLPTVNIGDALINNGPACTNIDIQYGTQGMTTTYRFQTFTQRFGNVPKATTDRIRQTSLNHVRLTNEMRKLARVKIQRSNKENKPYTGFLDEAMNVVNRQSPHPIMIAQSIKPSGSNVTRQFISSSEVEDAFVMSGSGLYQWNACVAMSVDGLYRPVSTDPTNYFMGYYDRTTTTPGIGSNKLFPLPANNDIEVYSWGNTYGEENFHAYRLWSSGVVDLNTTRFVAHKGPMVMTGWGYDLLTGTPTPSGSSPNTFASGYLRKAENWQTGPIDHMWDSVRGVWTNQSLMVGYTVGQVLAGSSGFMTLYDGTNSLSKNLSIWNWFSVGISGTKKVMAQYVPYANKFYVIAADC